MNGGPVPESKLGPTAAGPAIDSESGKGLFPIIGVGASAGGLEAMTDLLANMPGDTGMAVVLVQHLEPKHESRLRDILSKATAMPVLEARHGMVVEPNHVYVIPPNTTMTIAQGTLQLAPREAGRGIHLPIDQFFKSLAVDREAAAIGVILSGTGSDGTLGAEELKAAGGITFAQDEKTAKQAGMPDSAIRSGCVDMVLSPQAIAQELTRIATHPYVAAAPAPEASPARADEEAHFHRILGLLHSSFGVDFRSYRDTTLRRRIMRRMVLHTKDSLGEYVRHLEKEPPELEALYEDILINVTSFFREPESFEALKQHVFPQIVKGKTSDGQVRVWTPGCSTGQEAYSLAMALTEFFDEQSLHARVQIFATDLSDAVSLRKAREGYYPANIEAELSPGRLRRFFTKENGKYRINREIRDMCLFAKQNVAADPPFSRVDLISCRNLLIYLAPPLQKRVIPTFHYALNPHGFLLLGASETVGPFTDLFGLVDHTHRIYVKKAGAVRAYPHFSAGHFPTGLSPEERRGLPPTPPVGDWQREADRLVLGSYAPPGVLVNSNLEIVQFRAQTGAYLTPAPGEASFNILKMAREGLFPELRAALSEARQKNAEVRREGVPMRTGAHTREISLRVLPVKLPGNNESCFLVLFEEPGTARGRGKGERAAAAARPLPPAASAPPPQRGLVAALQRWFTPAIATVTPGAAAAQRENAQLRQELDSTREYLQSLIAQQDAANEELKSANEEILSANEELQSTNEELETAREELQSVNEELTTVNEQMHNRNAELTRLNDDISNLLSSANVPVVSLGADLRVRRFTPAAGNVLRLSSADVGRAVSTLRLAADVPDLEALAEKAIETVQVQEREIRDRHGHRHILRVHPYRTADNKIDGAVVVLIDVTEQRRANEARWELAAIVESSHDAIISKTLDGTITSWNKGAQRLYGYTAAEMIGKPVASLSPPERSRETEEALARLQTGHVVEPFEATRQRKDGQLVEVSVSLSPIYDDAGKVVGAAGIERDIGPTKRLANQLKEADRRKNEFLAMLSHELRNPLAPLRNGLQILEMAGKGGEETDKAREMMERQVEHLSRLIDDLLDMSRVTHGRIELRQERVDLSTAVKHAIEACRPALEAAGHALTVHLTDQPLFVHGDPIRLIQIAENLLTNAIKYSRREGQITVTVEGSHQEAVLRVKDTGDGIPPDLLPRIWDLFMQGDSSDQRRRSGLGIGLTLVRSLVQMHGGSVEAHSDGPGQGSEFVVRLPADSAAPASPEQQPPPLLQRPGPPTSGHSMLVVDDNTDAAESLATLLRLLGNNVRTAYDGPTALAAIAQECPEIVLMDIGLPGMNGHEIARTIRDNHGPDKPILIALSGYGTEEDRQRSQDAGFNAHFVKPMPIGALQKLLAQTR